MHLSGYLMPMELAGLLLILMAVVVAVAIMRTWRGGKGKGTHRLRGDQDRPMTKWADEREFERPQSDATEGEERETCGPDSHLRSVHGLKGTAELWLFALVRVQSSPSP